MTIEQETDPLRRKFRQLGLYNMYGEDERLARELGFEPNQSFAHGEYASIGTIQVGDEATVECSILMMPSQFYRFVIERDDEGAWVQWFRDNPDAPRDNESKLIDPPVFPKERLVISTGSGRFAEYWPIAKQFARGMVNAAYLEGHRSTLLGGNLKGTDD